MLRPSLIACSECACHVRANEETCPHCGAELAGTVAPSKDSRTLKRAAIAVSLGLAVSVAQLTACDDTSNAGGAGGATSTSGSKSSSASSLMGSDSSAIATYGVGSTSNASTGTGN